MIQTKLGRKKLHQQGNPKKNLGAYSMRGATTRRLFLSVHRSLLTSPFGPLRTPISASNRVILLLFYAHRQKFRIFLTRRRRGIEKVRISGVLWGLVFCLSATAYIEHQICMQKAWVIRGDVVDVLFGVSDPTNNGTPMAMGTTKPQKVFDFKNLFYIAHLTQKNSLISTVPLFSKYDEKWRRYRKNVISA